MQNRCGSSYEHRVPCDTNWFVGRWRWLSSRQKSLHWSVEGDLAGRRSWLVARHSPARLSSSAGHGWPIRQIVTSRLSPSQGRPRPWGLKIFEKWVLKWLKSRKRNSQIGAKNPRKKNGLRNLTLDCCILGDDSALRSRKFFAWRHPPNIATSFPSCSTNRRCLRSRLAPRCSARQSSGSLCEYLGRGMAFHLVAELQEFVDFREKNLDLKFTFWFCPTKSWIHRTWAPQSVAVVDKLK